MLYAGTSGFAYPSWKPGFYPAKLPAAKFLEHYATRLNSTEVNYTFRRLLSGKTIDGWLKCTPAGFVFSLKAHWRITHILRLKDTGSFLEAFFGSVAPLAEAGRLGVILFQLAPDHKCDAGVLTAFLGQLPAGHRYAFEFRHASWFTDEVFGVLRARGVALCVAESEKLETPDLTTAQFAYFRYRKPEYAAEERAGIVTRLQTLLDEGRDVYAYFKHEESPAGALLAEETQQAFSGR
jgi:uncharacterized protein YecE (DUF72 family)